MTTEERNQQIEEVARMYASPYSSTKTEGARAEEKRDDLVRLFLNEKQNVKEIVDELNAYVYALRRLSRKADEIADHINERLVWALKDGLKEIDQ